MKVVDQDRLHNLLNSMTNTPGQPQQSPGDFVVLNNLAVILHELERYLDANALYLRSLALAEQSGNRPLIAQSISNRAAMARDMQIYPEAERLFQVALRIWKEIGFPSLDTMPSPSADVDWTRTPIWVERPDFQNGHALARLGSWVDRLKQGVAANDPASLAALHDTLSKLAPWYHNVDMGFGISTLPSAGDYPQSRWAALQPFVPENLDGKTILDIGCNSGFFSYRFKERGAARVVGIDLMPHILAQARFLTHWFKLPVELYEMSAYDIGSLRLRFDHVVFVGVLYHLKHPLYALEKVSEVCNGTLYFQTVLRGPTGDFNPPEDFPAQEEQVFAEPDFPKLYFVEKSFNGDESNWWFATRSCVKAMLRTSGFRDIQNTIEPDVFVCKRN